MEGLGKDFDVVAAAEGVWLNLRDYASVTFIGLTAADDFTIQEATAVAGTGAQNLTAIGNTYSQTDGDGTDTWTKRTADAGTAVADAQTTDKVVAVHIPATALSDGFGYVSCNAAATGTVVAILHGLAVQRDPSALSAVSA